MSSQEQDAFQVSSSSPLTIHGCGVQVLMIGMVEISIYCNCTYTYVLQYYRATTAPTVTKKATGDKGQLHLPACRAAAWAGAV